MDRIAVELVRYGVPSLCIFSLLAAFLLIRSEQQRRESARTSRVVLCVLDMLFSLAVLAGAGYVPPRAPGMEHVAEGELWSSSDGVVNLRFLKLQDVGGGDFRAEIIGPNGQQSAAVGESYRWKTDSIEYKARIERVVPKPFLEFSLVAKELQ